VREGVVRPGTLLICLIAFLACDGNEGARDARAQDLARFVGEYGTSDSERARRTIWVFRHCDGHLVAGATWGSASPWHLDPVSDTDFVQRVPEGVPPVRLEFTIGDAEAVEELRVLYDDQPLLPEFPRLRRLRELPAGFEGIECWDRP
jgi:hypothetical protein